MSKNAFISPTSVSTIVYTNGQHKGPAQRGCTRACTEGLYRGPAQGPAQRAYTRACTMCLHIGPAQGPAQRAKGDLCLQFQGWYQQDHVKYLFSFQGTRYRLDLRGLGLRFWSSCLAWVTFLYYRMIPWLYRRSLQRLYIVLDLWLVSIQNPFPIDNCSIWQKEV